MWVVICESGLDRGRDWLAGKVAVRVDLYDKVNADRRKEREEIDEADLPGSWTLWSDRSGKGINSRRRVKECGHLGNAVYPISQC